MQLVPGTETRSHLRIQLAARYEALSRAGGQPHEWLQLAEGCEVDGAWTQALLCYDHAVAVVTRAGLADDAELVANILRAKERLYERLGRRGAAAASAMLRVRLQAGAAPSKPARLHEAEARIADRRKERSL